MDEAIQSLPKRDISHCFAGSFGADWDKKGVEEEIKIAKKIAFTQNMFDHELAIETSDTSSWEGKVLRFDVKDPQDKSLCDRCGIELNETEKDSCSACHATEQDQFYRP